MAATAPIAQGRNYEEFVRLHAEPFTAYLRRMLGHQAEGRGGRVAVEDTLQEALLAIYAEWPELEALRDEERDRWMYRCLRDAAGRALRSEWGRHASTRKRPLMVSFDHEWSDVGESTAARDRELAATLHGKMARDLATDDDDQLDRLVLDRAVLVAGLRSLTEREAVVLIAVDHFDWNQRQLAKELEMSFDNIRFTLSRARRLFYTVVRHAVGVEVEDQERADLLAYLRGELKGAKRSDVGRHVQGCKACQELQREMRLFSRRALPVIAPIPALFGAHVLSKKASLKAAATGGAASGIFAQPGAAKAVAIVATLMTGGFVGIGMVAQLKQPEHGGPATAPVAVKGEVGWPVPSGRQEPAPPASDRSSSTAQGAGSSRPKATETKAKATVEPKHRQGRATPSAPGTTSRGLGATTNAAPTGSTLPASNDNGTNTRPDTNSKPKKPKNGGDCESYCG